MAVFQPSPELEKRIKELCNKAFDLRDEMAEKLFWHVRWSTVHACFRHCQPNLGKKKPEDLGKLQAGIEKIQGELAAITGGEDWYNDSKELNRWYDAEDKKRVETLGKMFVDMDY